MNEYNENFNNDEQQNVNSITYSSDENFDNVINEEYNNVSDVNSLTENKTQNSKAGKILLVILVGLIFLLTAGFSVYCITSDIKNISSNAVENNYGNIKNNITLNTVHRPVQQTVKADESGKYTVEGLAQAIKPQVVEIYSFADKNSDVAAGGSSGIIISEDGYIVTNAHVLDGMEKYVVNTFDGSSFEAKVIGKDAKTDIAVIKIEATGLTAAQFGDSDEIIQGESVVAIGNPAGLAGSITDGIVSGLNRKIKTKNTGFEMNCIQTNAAISPGSSGGALVNMYGQVIGITSSKYSSTTAEGLGFAITINDAIPIIEELITTGYVSGRVKIGITFLNPQEVYTAYSFKEEFGFDIPDELANSIWIQSVDKECDISKTKLKEKDFIISVDDKIVSNYDELYETFKDKKAGDKLKAKCARVSKDKKIEYFDIEFKIMEDTSGDF